MALDRDALAVLVGGPVTRVDRLAGGSLSDVLAIEREDGERFVVKQSPDPDLEAKMLADLGAAGVPVPRAKPAKNGWLVLDFVESERSVGPAWGDIGDRLRQLHDAHDAHYGYRSDSRFGAVSIANSFSDDWRDFWAVNRLLCHGGHIDSGLSGRLEKLAARLGDWLPATPPPSLLHGDLWGGNILVLDGRLAALIDPACYYGDAEVDLAMLTLFDTPLRVFWDAYGQLAPGWEERRAVYQLWPALVHLRLFGEGYRPMVEQCLAQLNA